MDIPLVSGCLLKIPVKGLSEKMELIDFSFQNDQMMAIMMTIMMIFFT